MLSLLLVSLLWVSTPIVVGIVESITADPRSGYGGELGMVIWTGLLYVVYLPTGLLAGLVLLFIKRSTGAGILAGTGLGAVAGFLTCLAILEG